MYLTQKRFWFVLCILCGNATSNAENIFLSSEDLEDMNYSEMILMKTLKSYIKVHENKLQYLKKKLLHIETNHEEAVSDKTAYIGNPINSYLLTKRLSSDWARLGDFMKIEVGVELLRSKKSLLDELIYPSQEDLNFTRIGLLNTQIENNFKSSDVAKGVWGKKQFGFELTVDECFDLGQGAFHEGLHSIARNWFIEALSKIPEDDPERLPILKHLMYTNEKESKYWLGNIAEGLTIVYNILKTDPNNINAVQYKLAFEDELEELGINPFIYEVPEFKESELDRASNELCTGKRTLTPTQMRNFRCRYFFGHSAFSKIAPYKVEDAYLEPPVLIFHDVISDKEGEILKVHSKPRLRAARLHGVNSRFTYQTPSRYARNASAKDIEYEEIRIVNRRMEDMTGLTTVGAEDIQISYYGFGGYFKRHYDFSETNPEEYFHYVGTGNRIATVLFYLNTVEEGGQTFYPNINVSVSAVKGKAVFWYNLYRSGPPDYRLEHGACPVTKGVKWSSNKWFHEHGNEFNHPCKLYDDRDTIERTFN